MGRLVFVNRFYWPEEPATGQLLTDLAEAMAMHGREVVVITSQPRRSRQTALEVRNGVTVRRVAGSKFGNRNMVWQACDFLTFALAALFRVAVTLRRGDTLVVLTDPPLLGVPATFIAKLRGALVIHWLQDIYPEAAILLTGRRVFRWLQRPRNAAWCAADACVTLGEDMASLPLAVGVPESRLHIVPNWAPAGVEVVAAEQAARLRGEWGLTDKFIVEYFGNLGRVHDLVPVLEIADQLRDEPRIEFVFIGPGAQRPHLESEATKRGLHNVRFFPAQPRERRTEVLALGDMHLVTLLEGAERVVYPSKLYGTCAAGKPVLFIGPRESEIASVIRKRKLGFAFARTDVAEIATAIRSVSRCPEVLREFGQAGREFYRTESSIEQAAVRWQQVLGMVEQPRGLTPVHP